VRDPAGAALTETMDAPPIQSALTELDRRHLRRALELAVRGRGTTHPNPMVGCVLADGELVLGEGWHERAGGPHAEALALAAAGAAARGATAYVTLEPCAHHGRTGPCADALIAAGIARVVYASPDPDPRVAGGGDARLREAGVEVVAGALRDEADAVNAAYLTHRRLGRPWVRYKTAMTLDGKIATRTGRSRWITGPEARALVQRWRHEADAVAVGVTTLLQDDPALTTRLAPDGAGRTARKVVFDAIARTPTTARVFDDGPDGTPARVTIVVGPDAPAARVRALEARGATVACVPLLQGRPRVATALRDLAADGVVELLLEGGGTLAWSFLAAGAIDRVAWFVAPKLVGGRGATPLAGLGVAGMDEAVTLRGATVRHVGEDLLIEGDLALSADAFAEPAASMGGGDSAAPLEEDV
jgi:diaminohydroxyphosphoribosylaminopyrimidine deaminase / 5-amino-6-(5-phosphoribosylamino)uracil reductase